LFVKKIGDIIMDYDVLLIHPPAVYDFRKMVLFPGVLGDTAENVQFIKVSIGMLSIAEYLDRHGYKVIIENLADSMVTNKGFDVEEFVKNSSAKIYAIGLHWQQHAQGAIEVARLCKKHHPDSLVILGGLTSTCFHKEIIQKHKFVDSVVRGEGEKPLLELVKAYNKYGKLTGTPSLTYRTDNNEVQVTPLMKPSENLDEFEFTRIDLIEPKTSIFNSSIPPRGSLIVCRGCLYNCVSCGGSAYSYKKYLGREKPAFRSPVKIVNDMRQLSEQGIRTISLYQDPRMGGYKYWKELMELLRRSKLNIDQITMDIFTPVDEEFVREVATSGRQTIFYVCPDTGCEKVRKLQGKNYSNEDLINTIKLCHKYYIPVVPFFSVGLSGETNESIKDMRDLWEKLRLLDQESIIKGRFGDIRNGTPIGGPITGPIILDPGSLAFDFPEKYGYKLLFKNLEEYIEGFSKPSWHQWLNYETTQLKKEEILDLIFESVLFSINQREEFGLYNNITANNLRIKLKTDMIAVEEVEHIMYIPNKSERDLKLKCLREAVDSVLNPYLPNKSNSNDYREIIRGSFK
jgi:B12-binding domain/radical SAM domain protein